MNLRDQNKNDIASLFDYCFANNDDSLFHIFTSAVFFLTNKDGSVVSLYYIGGEFITTSFISSLARKKIEHEQLHYSESNYSIDVIPTSLLDWEGYFGVIIKGEKPQNIDVQSLLVGYKQMLYMVSNNHNEFIPMLKQRDKDYLMAELLRETNYAQNFKSVAQVFIDKLKSFTRSGELTFFMLNNKDMFAPKFSTDNHLLEERVTPSLPEKEIREKFDRCSIIDSGSSKVEAISQLSLLKRYILLPIKDDDHLFGLLLYSDGNLCNSNVTLIQEFTEDASKLFNRLIISENVKKERKRKELLFKVTKKFHSSMNVSAILEEIILALKEIYPKYKTHLLLSHEWDVDATLPIKQLEYGNEIESVATKTYLSGEIKVEDFIDHSVLYAPLRGKQGIYGVLELTTCHSMHFYENEIDFIEVLADTGGNAIENAELYQQSRQLVEDLKLINNTTHKLNSNFNLSEMLTYMVKQIRESTLAQEVGFFLFNGNEIKVLEGSTSFFFNDNGKEVVAPYCNRFKKDKDAIFIGDLWMHHSSTMMPFRSFIAIPMVQNGELKGAVVAFHETANYFSFNKFKLLQSLIHHSTLAFTNSMLHEELERLVITDHLTQLYARNFLDDQVQESMEKDRNGCFLLFDIDNFKQINDGYGHQVGDDVIIQVANVIKKNIKSTDIAARWGGEEIAIYIPNVGDEIGCEIANRIIQKIETNTYPEVTASCGLAVWEVLDESYSLKKLFNQADQALYTAKRSGKNRVVIYNENTCYM